MATPSTPSPAAAAPTVLPSYVAPHPWRRRLLIPGLAVALLCSIVLGGMIGSMQIGPAQVIAIILDHLKLPTFGVAFDDGQANLLINLRLPRVLLGALIGSALAICGAALQGLFRNPLADPGLIGVSSGSAVGAIVAIVLGEYILTQSTEWMRPWLTSLCAFVGGVVIIGLVYRISSVGGRVVIATMLLTGIAVNSLVGAGIGLLTYVADDAQLRDITFWSLGSLGSASWTIVMIVAPAVLLAVLVLPYMGRSLNALLLGEAEAAHLGIDVKRVKRRIIVITALAVAASVAFTGLIGFVGLVVPHLVRIWIGPDHRTLLPASALLGAALMILADLAARTIIIPSEIPIGILTALIGAPFFLLMIFMQRSRLSL